MRLSILFMAVACQVLYGAAWQMALLVDNSSTTHMRSFSHMWKTGFLYILQMLIECGISLAGFFAMDYLKLLLSSSLLHFFVSCIFFSSSITTPDWVGMAVMKTAHVIALMRPKPLISCDSVLYTGMYWHKRKVCTFHCGHVFILGGSSST